MVSEFLLYFIVPSFHPARAYILWKCWKRAKINDREAGEGPFLIVAYVGTTWKSKKGEKKRNFYRKGVGKIAKTQRDPYYKTNFAII